MKERMTVAEYWEQISNPKPSKMRNKKTVVDGILFDSQREANHYCELKILKQAGEIIDYWRQVSFQLTDGYYLNGKWVRGEFYRADFVVIRLVKYPPHINPNPVVRLEIHEPKGHRTQAYRNKRKLFQHKYPEYEFIEI